MNVLVFGALTDLTNASMLEIGIVKDTEELLADLNTRFPQLADKKFAISVDKKIISENTTLHSNSEVALLPPFSGG